MSKIFLLSTLCINLFAFGQDQFSILFSSNGYVLYKVLDFASDHGFPFVKILGFETNAFDHVIQGRSITDYVDDDHYFEILDEKSHISFLCFMEKPKDPSVIEVEKYRFVLEHLNSLDDD